MHGEIVILKNRVDMLEHNVKPQGNSLPATSKNSINTSINHFQHISNFGPGFEGESISARGDNDDYQENIAPH